MADDPNRDILPVKEGSCVDPLHTNIDPRERHIVCKLDRYQLEDKYLRLLEEASNLKKLSNCQEDKIKRLATKLMRVSSNTRPCTLSLDVCDDKNRITTLELENTKLKDKITVLRNQLLSHTSVGRSSSRSRNPQCRPSSGRITCRSENSRIKPSSCQCIVGSANEENEPQNYLVRIRELENERKQMECRIVQLEKELSTYAVSSQREKVAENVEYIRVWRQMKQLNDKLMVAQNTNESLNVQINELKRILEETTKNNQEVTGALVAEKKRLAEIDEQMVRAKDSQLSLREKDEQIKDLLNEMKILQQHNNELIALSSRYSQVELENAELKKRVSEQLQDQQTLKSAFNTEQANIVALQTVNERLLTKLQELQKNIDTLTVQLTCVQVGNGKQETPSIEQGSPEQVEKKNQGDSSCVKLPIKEVGICKKCCETYEKILELEKAVNTPRDVSRTVDRSIQTDEGARSASVMTKEQATSTMTPVKTKNYVEEEASGSKCFEEETGKNTLTPEKMLKLLDQAQINTPLEATRIGRKDPVSSFEYDVLDMNQRHSDAEVLIQTLEDHLIYIQKIQKKILERQIEVPRVIRTPSGNNPNKILFPLFNIMEDRIQCAKDINKNVGGNKSLTIRKIPQPEPKKNEFANRQFVGFAVPKISDSTTNSNLAHKGCSNKKICSRVQGKLRVNKLKLKNSDINVSKGQMQVSRFTETAECSCTDGKRCYANDDCGFQCCPSNSMQSVAISSKNSASELVQSKFEGICSPCSRGDEESIDGLKSKLQNDAIFAEENQDLQGYIKEIEKCKKLLAMGAKESLVENNVNRVRDGIDLSDGIERRETRSLCGLQLDSSKDYSECSGCISDTYPLLITDEQGLLELHVLQLQLSTSAKQILFREEELSAVSLFLSWKIWDQETTCTQILKCPKLNFNSSFVYRIPKLFGFFNYVLDEYIMFQVNIVRENNDDYIVARAKLCIKDILDYPQNKLHYIAPMNSAMPCSLGMNFGQLSLWVRLSCNVEKVEAFKKQYGLQTSADYGNSASVDDKSMDQQTKESGINDLHLLQQHDPIKELLAQRKTIFEEERFDDDQIKKEDIKMEDPSGYAEKEKEQVKDSNRAEDNVLLENVKTDKDTIIIEIVDMVLFRESWIMSNKDISMIYVTYSFLGHQKEDMETASTEKLEIVNQKIIYNFQKKFTIDKENHLLERSMLRAMLNESISPIIKFVVISEPLPEETEIKECMDVGYADFNIREFALRNDHKVVSLPIMSVGYTEQMGVLRILVLGLNAIHQCLENEDI